MLSMLRKDLRRTVRLPLGVLVLLAFPLIFSLMLAVTFGGGESPSIPKVRLLIQDDDGELGARLIASALDSEQLSSYFDVEEAGAEEGSKLMERDDASALLLIPEGFTEDLLRGRPTSLKMVRNPAERILPEVAEQTALVLTDVLSAASRVLRGPLDELVRMIDAEELPDADLVELVLAVRNHLDSAAAYLFPPAIVLEALTVGETAERDDSTSGTALIFIVVLPGISVFSLFMIGDHSMRDILSEKAAGTLRRQLSGPVRAITIVCAKTLHTAVLASISVVVLFVIGWSVSPLTADVPGLLLQSAAVVLLVAGATSLVYGMARSERQGSTIGSAIFLLAAFVGGSFFPADQLPAMLRTLSPYSPFYWANAGFNELLRNEAGVREVLPHAAKLAALGAVALFLGGRLLERRTRQGGAG